MQGEASKGNAFSYWGAGASKNGGEAAIFCELKIYLLFSLLYITWYFVTLKDEIRKSIFEKTHFSNLKSDQAYSILSQSKGLDRATHVGCGVSL